MKNHAYFSQIDFSTLHNTRPLIESEFDLIEPVQKEQEPESQVMTLVMESGETIKRISEGVPSLIIGAVE